MLANARRNPNEAGFTLLEVLIAGVIAALALVVLFHSGLEGLDGVRVAGHTEQAIAIARSRLALLTTGAPRIGETQGHDGIFAWRCRVGIIATAVQQTDIASWVRQSGDGKPILLSVTVDVAWRESNRADHVQLETQRLGFAPPPGSAP